MLSLEGELALTELDKNYRDVLTGDIFPSCSKELFYMVAHHPSRSSLLDDPDYYPNHYIFFVNGHKDRQQREQSKAFVLFLDGDAGNFVRVFNVAELRAYRQELESQGNNLSIAQTNDLMEKFWKTVGIQTSLGAALPNHEDMEDFRDIVNSWETHHTRQTERRLRRARSIKAREDGEQQ